MFSKHFFLNLFIKFILIFSVFYGNIKVFAQSKKEQIKILNIKSDSLFFLLIKERNDRDIEKRDFVDKINDLNNKYFTLNQSSNVLKNKIEIYKNKFDSIYIKLNEISSNNLNPITIDYINEINGFKVKVIWLIDSYDSYIEKFIGPAILSFKDNKTNQTYNLTHDCFSIDILPENKKFIQLIYKDGVEVYQNNSIFSQKMEYKLPEITIEDKFKIIQHNVDINSTDRNAGFIDYIPFFFKDVDFDNKPDLILTLAKFYTKGGFENKLYSFDEFGIEQLFNQNKGIFWNFFSNAYTENQYCKSIIDYKTRKVYFNSMHGCCFKSEEIYEDNLINHQLNFIYKTDYDSYDSNVTIITKTESNGKIIVSKKKKNNFIYP